MKVSRPNSSRIRQEALNKTSEILKISQPDQFQGYSPSTEPTCQSPALISSHPHATPPKRYRIEVQDVYNYVRNSISQTFQPKASRNYHLVKELTDITVPEQGQVIDRLCKKYSILRHNRRGGCFENAEVNVEEIANRYVKSKSLERQKDQYRRRLKIDIATNYRYGKNKEYLKSDQFFNLDDAKEIKNLQKRYQQKNRIKTNKNTNKNTNSEKKTHPYIELYQKAQQEVLDNLATHKNLELTNDFPTLPQLEEWQKNSHHLRRVLKTRHEKKREVQSARPRNSGSKTSRNLKPDFYLT